MTGGTIKLMIMEILEFVVKCLIVVLLWLASTAATCWWVVYVLRNFCSVNV